MAVGVAKVKLCVLCDESMELERSSVQISSQHVLFPGHASVKAAIKHVMLRGGENMDSPLIDSILQDEGFICTSCLERTVTCLHLQEQIQSAENLMQFALREG